MRITKVITATNIDLYAQWKPLYLILTGVSNMTGEYLANSLTMGGDTLIHSAKWVNNTGSDVNVTITVKMIQVPRDASQHYSVYAGYATTYNFYNKNAINASADSWASYKTVTKTVTIPDGYVFSISSNNDVKTIWTITINN